MTENTYQITATVERRVNGWNSSTQVPIFFVNAVSAGEAKTKANAILNPYNTEIPHFTVYCEATGEYLDSDKRP